MADRPQHGAERRENAAPHKNRFALGSGTQYEVRSVASARCFLGRFLPKLGGAPWGAAIFFHAVTDEFHPSEMTAGATRRPGAPFRGLERDQAALAAFRGRPTVLRATSGITAAGLRPRPIDLASAERFSA